LGANQNGGRASDKQKEGKGEELSAKTSVTGVVSS
jgi:hypothetical protein